MRKEGCLGWRRKGGIKEGCVARSNEGCLGGIKEGFLGGRMVECTDGKDVYVAERMGV